MKCLACNGTGQTLHMVTQQEDRFAMVWASCITCEGTGTTPESAFNPQSPVTLTIYRDSADVARVTEVPAWMARRALAHWASQPGVRAVAWSVKVNGEFVLGQMAV